jgi:HD-like signal output (HDOD) protein
VFAPDDRDSFVLAMLVEQILSRVRSPTYQPPLLPDVALQILELTRHPDATAKEVAELLSQDAVLAAAILRVANSAAFRVATPARTLHEATVRLGNRTMTAVLFDVWSRAKLFRAPAGYEAAMTVIRRHAAASAHLARVLAGAISIEPDFAYLCGLLHDVGFALGLSIAAEVRPPEELPPLPKFFEALRVAHVGIGTTLCTYWKLPGALIAAVRDHHAIADGGFPGPGAALVCVAEGFAARAGFGIPGDAPTPDEELRARDALAVPSAVLERMELEALRLAEIVEG